MVNSQRHLLASTNQAQGKGMGMSMSSMMVSENVVVEFQRLVRREFRQDWHITWDKNDDLICTITHKSKKIKNKNKKKAANETNWQRHPPSRELTTSSNHFNSNKSDSDKGKQTVSRTHSDTNIKYSYTIQYDGIDVLYKENHPKLKSKAFLKSVFQSRKTKKGRIQMENEIRKHVHNIVLKLTVYLHNDEFFGDDEPDNETTNDTSAVEGDGNSRAPSKSNSLKDMLENIATLDRKVTTDDVSVLQAEVVKLEGQLQDALDYADFDSPGGNESGNIYAAQFSISNGGVRKVRVSRISDIFGKLATLEQKVDEASSRAFDVGSLDPPSQAFTAPSTQVDDDDEEMVPLTPLSQPFYHPTERSNGSNPSDMPVGVPFRKNSYVTDNGYNDEPASKPLRKPSFFVPEGGNAPKPLRRPSRVSLLIDQLVDTHLNVSPNSNPNNMSSLHMSGFDSSGSSDRHNNMSSLHMSSLTPSNHPNPFASSIMSGDLGDLDEEDEEDLKGDESFAINDDDEAKNKVLTRTRSGYGRANKHQLQRQLSRRDSVSKFTKAVIAAKKESEDELSADSLSRDNSTKSNSQKTPITIADEMLKLKSLLDDGVLSEQEFRQAKRATLKKYGVKPDKAAKNNKTAKKKKKSPKKNKSTGSSSPKGSPKAKGSPKKNKSAGTSSTNGSKNTSSAGTQTVLSSKAIGKG